MAVTQTKQQVLAAAFESARKRNSFYFEPQSRLQLVDKLQHLSRFSDFLLVVTGPEGAGKTTLLEQLQLSDAETTLRSCLVKEAGEIGLTGLLATLANQLSGGLPDDADDQLLLSAVYDAASVMAAEHIQWIIMVDDATSLTEDALNFLLQLLSDSAAGAAKPHLMLLGSPELLPRLKRAPDFVDLAKQVHHLELAPFSDDEAKDYLLQRYSAADSLSNKQLQAVYKASNAQPGGLNRAIEELFRSGSASRQTPGAVLPRLHLVSIGAILLGVLAVSLWQYWPESSPRADASRTRIQLRVPLVVEQLPEAVSAVPVAEVSARRLDSEAANQPLTDTSLPDAARTVQAVPEGSPAVPVATGAGVVAELAGAQGDVSAPASAAISSLAVAVPEAPVVPEGLQDSPAAPVAAGAGVVPVAELAGVQGDVSAPASAAISSLAVAVPVAPVAPKGFQEPLAAPQASVVTAQNSAAASPDAAAPQKLRELAPKESVVSTPATPAVSVVSQGVAEPVVGAAKPVVQPAAKSDAAASNDWSGAERVLMGWPRRSYTLQLLGAATEARAETFIQRQAEPQKFYLFKASYKNKPWYVVVYGQYKDRATAMAASQLLPEKLRKLKPWVRSVQGIQRDIQQRKQ